MRHALFSVRANRMWSAFFIFLRVSCLYAVSTDKPSLERIKTRADALRKLYPQTAPLPSSAPCNDSDYPRVATRSEMMAKHCFRLMECINRVENACAATRFASRSVSHSMDEQAANDFIVEMRQLMRFLSINDIEVDWQAVKQAVEGLPTARRYCFPIYTFRKRITSIIGELNAINDDLDAVNEALRTFRFITADDINPDGLVLDGSANWPIGVYKFTEDVTYTGTVNSAIYISANSMVVDLAGYTLRGVEQIERAVDTALNVSYCTVQNGFITDFARSPVIFFWGQSPPRTIPSEAGLDTVRNMMLVNTPGVCQFDNVSGSLAENVICAYSLDVPGGMINVNGGWGPVVRNCVFLNNGRSPAAARSNSGINMQSNPGTCCIGLGSIACKNLGNGFRYQGATTGATSGLPWDTMYKSCVALSNLQNGVLWHQGFSGGVGVGGCTKNSPGVNLYAAGNGDGGATTGDYWACTQGGGGAFPNSGSWPYHMVATPTTATYWDNVGYTWGSS